MRLNAKAYSIDERRIDPLLLIRNKTVFLFLSLEKSLFSTGASMTFTLPLHELERSSMYSMYVLVTHRDSISTRRYGNR